MAKIIRSPEIINAAGNMPKRIEEFIGRVNSGNEDFSLAKMKSPPGWKEPGQTPRFNEYSLVLNGTLKVELKDKTIDVQKDQIFVAAKGEWVRYSSPEGAEYISLCIPAFSPNTVNRDSE